MDRSRGNGTVWLLCMKRNGKVGRDDRVWVTEGLDGLGRGVGCQPVPVKALKRDVRAPVVGLPEASADTSMCMKSVTR